VDIFVRGENVAHDNEVDLSTTWQLDTVKTVVTAKKSIWVVGYVL
jgi:hypothetical protein